MTLTINEAHAQEFKDAMASFASGVTVVTAFDSDGNPRGMTASAFSSVSLEPLLVLVCLHRESRLYRDVSAGGRFGVNILHHSAKHISAYCSRAGRDKRLKKEWLGETRSRLQPPILIDSLAYLDCAIDSEVPAGTHSVLLGSVRSVGLAESPDADPLVYFRGRYRTLSAALPISA